MLCSYTPWVQASYPQHLNLLNQNSDISIPKTKTQFQRKSFGSRFHDIDDDADSSGLLKFALPSHVKSITSTSNPFVKHCLKLKNSSSYRHSHASVLVVGTTPLREIYWYKEASQEKTVIDFLLLLDKAEIPEGLDTHSGHVVRISSTVMKKLSGVQSAESIEDPGNLGTLIRSAMAFQWGGVFLLPGCCDPFNEKALRASRGASFQLPIVSGSWSHLETLKGTFNMKMLAGHPDADWKTEKPFSLSQEFVHSLVHAPLCLVLGSEGRGLSEKSQLECELVSIPMSGKFESLNVSVAGGIFLYMLQPKN
ncbi:uncharacterized tRNA/rRNA methyltransferase YsgA-like isoform X2 [Hibiscus syriacus]|uniref:uncharacterized tRNA/rRNA methyltransferase YsgA-like isoform X2 n=1 Tax=Hibiscus syriacus TaxID=106335 RepID=UPI00192043E9|nr:uncharacterized tRNA/rRNA methyltransferase YsgA-like isoform X2 [Hibiscus syriacus]